MKKIFKIGAVTLLFLIICITTANAAGIVINLEDYAQQSSTLDSNLENIVSDEEIDISEDEENTPRVTSTKTSSYDDEFLTVENILSIIIIVIGVLLIFLAIAILIRLK